MPDAPLYSELKQEGVLIDNREAISDAGVPTPRARRRRR